MREINNNNKNVKSMKKNLFLVAAALAALVSCTSDEFVGDQSPQVVSGTEGAINFNGGANRITRATANSGDANVMLDNQFKVAAVKSGATAGSDMQTVMNNYGVWHNTTHTTSNSANWEYVEPGTSVDHGSSDNPMSLSNQTIKYWDYSAADYRFVAGSPYQNFDFTITGNDIVSATVTGIAGHLTANPTGGEGSAITTNPIYIAQPIKTTAADHATLPVQFQFVRQQSRVRVGIYETIPGYSISEIHFYKYNNATTEPEAAAAWNATAETGTNIILASATENYFRGATGATATLTYDWSTPSYTYAYSSGLTQDRNWYGGTMTGVGATTSTETTTATLYGTDLDMDGNGYFTVIPSPDDGFYTAQPILIKCDYTLTSLTTAQGGDSSGETIKVTGATAAIPAAYSYWKPNTSYTYLFKISDNTNGSTGGGSVGLYPIQLDAVVTAEASGTEQGTITTVSIPSITTYQDGSVVEESGIKYKYVDKDNTKPIYITVQDNTSGNLIDLTTASTSIKVYALDAAKTEADLQVTAPTTEVATNATTGAVACAIGNAAWSINGQSIAANYYATFTPGGTGYYAIEYTNASGVKTYKVVHVES